MTGGRQAPGQGPTPEETSTTNLCASERLSAVQDLNDLAALLRDLRRRYAHERHRPELTYREMASLTGLSRASIGAYFSGTALPPTDRFDTLTRLMGATPVEQGILATARDRVAEGRRHRQAQTPSAPDETVPELPVPRQLPADVPAFTGRQQELLTMDRLLLGNGYGHPQYRDEPYADPGGLCILCGTAGVGKTALAVRWAHRMREHFPDGSLHIDLRGYDPRNPMSAATALENFLRSLGLPQERIPLDESGLASTWRTMLDGRRMLLLLDNASDVEQVRPLLPGHRGCTVIVTSRDTLAGLVARNGAARMQVDLLPLADAVALLRQLIGKRADVEPTATTVLAEQGARLPLALRVSAELAASRPDSSLGQLVAELEDQQARLDQLDAGGDPRTAVQAVMSWSYRNLAAPAARLFRLMGLAPGSVLAEGAVAALADEPVESVRETVEILVQAHLVQESDKNRYTQHDLLRAYAARKASEEAPDESRQALTRLFDHYLDTASKAICLLYPDQRERFSTRPCSPYSEPLTDPVQARTWLDTERSTLVAVASHAAAHGWEEQATLLSGILLRYLNSGHSAEGMAIHSHALRAARATSDRAGQAHALIGLATAYWLQDHIEPATEHLREALGLFQAIGDLSGQARALGNLALIHQRMGQLDPALEELQDSLALSRKLAEPSAQAYTLLNIGLLVNLQGKLEQAEQALREALDLFGSSNDSGRAHVLRGLSGVMLRTGRKEAAADYAQEATEAFEELGDGSGQARALLALGLTRLEQLRPDAADACLGRALLLFREAQERSGIAETLNGLGRVSLATGRLAQARAHYLQAIDVATEVRNDFEAGLAHDGLAHIHRESGATAKAQIRWSKALALLTPLQVLHISTIKAHLKETPSCEDLEKSRGNRAVSGCGTCRALETCHAARSAALR